MGHLTSRIGFVASLLALGLCFSSPARASGVPPGTQIKNTVAVTYTQDGVTSSGTADNVVTVDQLVDVVASWQDGAPVQASVGVSTIGLLFKLTNTGNGTDRYTLTAAARPGSDQEFSAEKCRIYLDNDHDGRYSDADPLYIQGANDPSLAGDASVGVLVVCSIPGNAPNDAKGPVQLVATSHSYSGKLGDVKPGAGVSGVDIVLGASGGIASATGTYWARNVEYSLKSTQVIVGPHGGNVAASGGTITYTLTLQPSGDATGHNLVVVDPIPRYTTYVPGSLIYDGVQLGDGDGDGDQGDFNLSHPNAATIYVGDMPGTAPPHSITFQVTIN
jgi:uncharacterized repeat protein (TIGR01451 family)